MIARDRNSSDDSYCSNASEYGLTSRQMDILGYLAEGFSNKEIAKVTEHVRNSVFFAKG